MITLRHHAVSIAAIFLALAIGIVIGSGLLSDTVVSGLRDDKAVLRDEVAAQEQRADGFAAQLTAADDFDAAIADRVVAGILDTRTVLLVTTPDTDPADVDAIAGLVAAAGGSVTGRLALTDAFLDAANADQVRSMVGNVVPAGVQLQTGAVDQGSLAGDLLGSVLQVHRDAPPPSEADRALVLDTLRGAGFVDIDGGVAPASTAIVVSGGSVDAATGGNRGSVLARFVSTFATRGAGAVLAGRTGSADGNGAVGVVRADAALASRVSTVDNVDRESGRITAVRALAQQAAGTSGRYGTGRGADAVTLGAR